MTIKAFINKQFCLSHLVYNPMTPNLFGLIQWIHFMHQFIFQTKIHNYQQLIARWLTPEIRHHIIHIYTVHIGFCERRKGMIMSLVGFKGHEDH